MTHHKYKKDPSALRALTQEQYHVTQESGTERPFFGTYWNHFEEGVYVDVVSGEPLFSSHDKFDAHCGWPSFSKPLESSHVKEFEDDTYGMRRIEVRSTHGNSHLGHVFDDGPGETGLRYCINSASLRFIPKSRLEQAGYAEYITLFKKEAA